MFPQSNPPYQHGLWRLTLATEARVLTPCMDQLRLRSIANADRRHVRESTFTFVIVTVIVGIHIPGSNHPTVIVISGIITLLSGIGPVTTISRAASVELLHETYIGGVLAAAAALVLIVSGCSTGGGSESPNGSSDAGQGSQSGALSVESIVASIEPNGFECEEKEPRGKSREQPSGHVNADGVDVVHDHGGVGADGARDQEGAHYRLD